MRNSLKMIFIEIKKIINIKRIIISALILLAVNFLFSFVILYLPGNNAVSQMNLADVYNEFLDVSKKNEESWLEQRLDQNTVFLSDHREVLPKYFAYQKLDSFNRDCSSYKDYVEKVITNSNYLLQDLTEFKSFYYRNIVSVKEYYSKLNPLDLRPQNEVSVKYISMNIVTDLLLIAETILLSVFCVSAEKKQGTNLLTCTTVSGQKKQIYCKFFSLCVLVFGSSVLLYFENFLTSYFLIGEFDLCAPVQSVFGFIECAYSWTIAEYLFFTFFLKFLHLAVLISFSILVSSALYDILASLSVVSFFLSIEALLYNKIEIFSHNVLLKEINLFSLYHVNDSIRFFYNVDVFNQAIPSLVVRFWGNVILIITNVYLANSFFGMCLTNNSIKFFQKRKKISNKKKIVRFEMNKFFISQKAVFITVSIFLVAVAINFFGNDYVTLDEYYYRAYCISLSEKEFYQQESYLKSEYQSLENAYLDLSNADQSYRNGLISESEYNTLVKEISGRENKRNALERLIDQCEKIRLHAIEKNIRVKYTTFWDKLLSLNDFKCHLWELAVTGLYISLVLPALFCGDEENGLDTLLCTLPNARIVKEIKKRIAYSVTSVFAILVTVQRAVYLYSVYQYFDPTVKISEVYFDSKIAAGLSCIYAFLFLTMLKTIIVQAECYVIERTSRKLKTSITCSAFSIAIFVIPFLVIVFLLI